MSSPEGFKASNVKPIYDVFIKLSLFFLHLVVLIYLINMLQH